MRFVVVRTDGRFVRFQTIPGSTPPTTYSMTTTDAVDAHDFGSRIAAEKWIRENGGGKVAELTDSGHWPIED